MPAWLATVAPHLNVAGLVLTTVAAVLLALYPPRVAQYTQKGERVVQVVTWVSTAQDVTLLRGRVQLWLSRLGPWILALGFVCQVPNALAPLMG